MGLLPEFERDGDSVGPQDWHPGAGCAGHSPEVSGAAHLGLLSGAVLSELVPHPDTRISRRTWHQNRCPVLGARCPLSPDRSWAGQRKSAAEIKVLLPTQGCWELDPRCMVPGTLPEVPKQPLSGRRQSGSQRQVWSSARQETQGRAKEWRGSVGREEGGTSPVGEEGGWRQGDIT